MGAAQNKAGRGLGRGLNALLGDAPAAREEAKPDLKEVAELARGAAPDTDGRETGAAPRARGTLPIEQIQPNPDQPRRAFNEDAIADLAASIKARGMLQPILVRPVENGLYQIVAGERRWRAAQRAQLHDIPVLIRELTDEATAEIALIENIQRVDLNPIEEAEAYQRLSEVYGRKQEEIAKAVGKSRSHVTNIMRLLTLPERARKAAISGALTMGHARALLGAPDPDALLDEVVRGDLSVRETEALVRARNRPEPEEKPFLREEKPKPSAEKKDADTRALEADLAAALGLEVEIAHGKNGAGAVTVRYLNLDQLDEICRRLMETGV